MASVHDETTTNSSNETYRDRQRNADLLVQALRPRYIQETRNGRVVKESAVVRLNAAYKYCFNLENTIKSICLEHEVPMPNHCQLLTGRDKANTHEQTGRQSSRKRKSNEHHVPSAHSSPIDVTETPTTSSGGSSTVGGIGDSGGDDKMNKVTFAPPPVVLETPINNTLSELGIKKRRLDMDINNNEVSMSESFQCGSYSLRRRSRTNPTSSTPAYSPLLKPKKKTPTKSKNDTESPANHASVDLHVPSDSASSLSLPLMKCEATTTSHISPDETKHVMDAMIKEVNTDILEKILNDDLHDNSQRNV